MPCCGYGGDALCTGACCTVLTDERVSPGTFQPAGACCVFELGKCGALGAGAAGYGGAAGG